MKEALSIFLKALELILTITCVIVKKLSDKHSERVFVRNQKFSSEWRLLNNIAWSNEADDFSELTFIGYTFITTVLLFTRIIRKNSNYHTCEKFFLAFGAIFFSIEGLLIFSTVEQLPADILPYAYALGTLSFICAIIFAIDILFFKDINQAKDAIAQTDIFLTKQEEKQQVKIVSTIAKLDNSCQHSLPYTHQACVGSNYLRTDL